MDVVFRVVEERGIGLGEACEDRFLESCPSVGVVRLLLDHYPYKILFHEQ